MNGYDVYLGNMLFPISPESITMKINGKNVTHDLINDGEINVLKLAGLTTVNFTVLLPAVRYPFANYKAGFYPPSAYLDELEALKQSQQPVQFIVVRNDYVSGKTYLHNTDITVSLEDYTVKDDAKEGFDLTVDISLKQYKFYATKTFYIEKTTSPVKVKKKRKKKSKKTSDSSSSGKKKIYKVQIPGMGVVKVRASSIQDAIKTASGKNWSGTIYVDGKSYTVEKGVLKTKTTPTGTTTTSIVTKTVEAVKKTVKSITDFLTTVFSTTGKKPTTTPTPKPKTQTTGGNYQS